MDINQDVGGYAYTIIRQYLEKVQAEAYPLTPEQVGGEAYLYFKEHYDHLTELLENNDVSNDIEQNSNIARRLF